jgi:tetratricopeptide (TPR) repeat protein
MPRPGMTMRTGLPNACNDCHTDKSVEWAIQASNKFFGRNYNDTIIPREIFFSATQSIPGAGHKLAEIAIDDSSPSIIRAEALFYLKNYHIDNETDPSEHLLEDSHPLIRFGALEAISARKLMERYHLLYPLLFDSLDGIRFAAERALSDLNLDQVNKIHKLDFSKAMYEYVHTLSLISDLPETSIEIGKYHIANDNYDMADSAFHMALRIDSLYFPAYEALARIYQLEDDIPQAKEMFEKALSKYPSSAQLHHYYAEFLAGQGQIGEAIVEFKTACIYDPENSVFAYDLAGSLNLAKKDTMALEILRNAAKKFPYNFRIQIALADQLQAAGKIKDADELRGKLHKMIPWNSWLSHAANED